MKLNNNQQQQPFYTIKWQSNKPQPNFPADRLAKVYPYQQLQKSLNNFRSQLYSSHLMNQHSLVARKQPYPSQIINSQQSIKLNIRSQLIRRTRKYQITTNNAHKKYINCLRNLFYEALSQKQIEQFQQRFIKQKSSRVFFFIILVEIKYRFSQQLAQAVKEGFHIQMKQKIRQYEEQILKCNDSRLKNYRDEEIHQIEIALKAINEFYQGNTSLAVEYLYRKNKHIIVKQNHFRSSLKLIQDLQKELSSTIDGPKITHPYIKDHYHRKINRVDEKKKQPYDNDLSVNQQQQQMIENKVHIESNQQNSLLSSNAINQYSIQQQKIASDNNMSQPLDQSSVNGEEQMSSNQQEDLSQSEKGHNDNADQEEHSYSYSSKSKSKSIKNSNSQMINNYEHVLPTTQQQQKQLMQNIVFPPIPPYFYLPSFDQKYGYLFRRLIYVKSWKQLNQRYQNQPNNNNNRFGQKKNQPAPSPLIFTEANTFFKRKQ